MKFRKYKEVTPIIGKNGFVHPTSVVIGDVYVGENSSIWPNAVLRADVNSIKIGNNTNIQDCSTIHPVPQFQYSPDGHVVEIGDKVTIGHNCVIHGCIIENNSLIGIGVILLDGCIVESNVMIGAGSIVPIGSVLRSGFLYSGNPATEIRELSDYERNFISDCAELYVELKNHYT